MSAVISLAFSRASIASTRQDVVDSSRPERWRALCTSAVMMPC